MKYIIVFILTTLAVSCNQSDSNKPEKTPVTDTAHSNASKKTPVPDTSDKPLVRTDPAYSKANGTVLLMASREILKSLKTKNFIQLASFVHPKLGVRFSPYAHINTIDDILLSPSQLIKRGKDQKIVKWGNYDGMDEKEIKMSINKYFDRFVYDKDFLSAGKISVNEFHGGGNSLNNLKEIYQDYNFTEFYFPGADPKYGGMDWHLLRLVFKIENKKPYLIAIVHDEWTI
jgi:hypothetical protein